MSEEITTRKRRHAIYDVSRIAGVSIGTVSRALSGNGSVSVRSREKVLSVARSLGYQPMTGVRQKQIALITEPPHRTVMGGFTACLTHYIVFELAKRRFSISLITEDEIDVVSRRLFDGIVAVAWWPKTAEILQGIDNTPIVWINRMDLKDKFNVVASDHYEAGQIVADYFIDHGHRRLGMLTGVRNWGAIARVDGLRETMQKRDVELDPRLIVYRGDSPLYAALVKLLDRGMEALWMPEENMDSLEVLSILQDVLKLRVPEDISIISGELPSVAQFTRPQLTTISQPLQMMAEQAVELVVSLRDCPAGNPKTVLLPSRIIERDSVENKTHI